MKSQKQQGSALIFKDHIDRIAVYMPSVAGGGAERAMVNLVNGLTEYSTPIDLVLVNATGPYRKDISQRVNIVDLKSPSTLRSLPKVISYIRKQVPGVIIAVLDHTFVTAMWAKTLSRADTRLCVSVQNNLSRASEHAVNLKERAMTTLLHAYYPKADEIIAVSKGVAEDVSQTLSIPLNRIQTIYNPVITPRVYSLAAEHVDHPWFQPNEPPVVLGIGRMTRQKDFGTLIHAFAKVVKRRPARMVILGEGEDRHMLEMQVKHLGLESSVGLPGFVNNPYAYLSRCGVFVLSSLWEGLPTVVIEALACGAPVVATDCPSGPSEILEGGVWGSLVPCADPSAMAASIIAALDTQASRIPSPRAEAFTTDNVVKQYLDLLDAR